MSISVPRLYLLIGSAIIVTTSSRKERLKGYLDVGDIDLTKEEVDEIDRAGVKGQLRDERKELAIKLSTWVLASLGGYAAYQAFFGA